MSLKNINIGIGITGSFCTFAQMIDTLQMLKCENANLIPIMSYNAYNHDTKFGDAQMYIDKVEKICENKILKTITEVEPIGPQNLLDLLLILPCTGNTAAKLANSISDTPVTCAVKSQLRNQKPVLLAISTNDGLSGNAKNIGALLNMKHIFFVPFAQDNPKAKPRSIAYDSTKVLDAIYCALQEKQLQPIICENK